VGLAAHFFFDQSRNVTTIDLDTLRNLIAPVVVGLGYELVEIEWKHEQGAWVLRLFVDGAAGAPPQDGGAVGPVSGISHDDCTRVSRAVSAELDVADPIAPAYTLEVSSPGLNRPLRAEADFRRFAGKLAKIKTRHPVGESRRNFRGTLLGAEGGKVRIAVDGQEFEIPVDDVEKAHLEYEF
jgi:ribosome maturation factor RimP